MRHASLSRPRGTARTGAPGRALVWTLSILGFLLLSLAAALRADSDDRLPASASRTQDFTASGDLKALAVENVNGPVEVVTGSSFKAVVDITVHAKTESQAKKVLDQVKCTFQNENGELSLHTDEPGTAVTRRGRRGWSVHSDHDGAYRVEARYRITVPANLAVGVSVVNGSIKTKGVTGDLELGSVNGKIEVEGAHRGVKLSSVNGGIDATLAELSKGTRIEAETVNGNIVLRLPASAGFRFEGRTMSGEILSTFALPVAAPEAREDEGIRAEREDVRADRERVRRDLKEKRKEIQKKKSDDDEVVVDLDELNADMADLSREMAEMGREIARSVKVNLNRSYEGTIGGGGATVRCSNLNGRIVLLAEGTTEAQAKPLVSPRRVRIVEIPHVGIPRVVVRVPQTPQPPEPPEPPNAFEAPRAPRPPKPPRAPRPPATAEPSDDEGGSIVRGDIDGDFHSSLPSGDVTLGRVSGRVKVSTGSGQVRVQSAGKGAEVSTAGGDVRLETVSGDVKAITSGGDVHVGSVSGDARLETSGGDVVVRSCGGSVAARTGGGDITLNRVTGAVKARTSGGTLFCEIVGAEHGGIDLSTSGGDVTLVLPSNYKGDVDARVNGVDSEGDYIVSQFPGIAIAKRAGSQTAEGKLNGGGPRITIRSTSGTVTIKRGPAV